MPGGEVRREEEGRDGNCDGEVPARPMHRLAEHPSQRPKEWQGQRKPPETRGDRAHAAVADEERTASQRHVTDKQCDEGKRMGFLLAHTMPTRVNEPRTEAAIGSQPISLVYGNEANL